MPTATPLKKKFLAMASATAAALALSACATVDSDMATGTPIAEPEMVTIPGGSFMMGRDGGEPDRYDGPPHMVTIKPFELAKYEVTHAEYKAFVDATGYQSANACSVAVDGIWGHRPWANWQNPGIGREPLDNEPVTCVSWFDVKAYIEWFSEMTGEPYRLPTEAEFEYALRAGSTTEYPWGDDPNGGCATANLFDASADEAFPEFAWEGSECSDGLPMVAPVGSLAPNPWGLYDITGNVWEWTHVCYVLPYPDDIPTDGSSMEVEGGCYQRTVRGGSWETRPSRMASAWRGRDKPHEAFRTFGFRLAK